MSFPSHPDCEHCNRERGQLLTLTEQVQLAVQPPADEGWSDEVIAAGAKLDALKTAYDRTQNDWFAASLRRKELREGSEIRRDADVLVDSLTEDRDDLQRQLRRARSDYGRLMAAESDDRLKREYVETIEKRRAADVKEKREKRETTRGLLERVGLR